MQTYIGIGSSRPTMTDSLATCGVGKNEPTAHPATTIKPTSTTSSVIKVQSFHSVNPGLSVFICHRTNHL